VVGAKSDYREQEEKEMPPPPPLPPRPPRNVETVTRFEVIECWISFRVNAPSRVTRRRKRYKRREA
jgi:hypothetical protein